MTGATRTSSATDGWTGGQYSLFRVLFGAYLLVHFAHLVPWGAEIFSSAGVLADGSLSPFLGLFPNVLALADGPVVVTGLLAAGVVLSLLLALGWHDRLAALLLWYLWACLFGRNPFISNPGLPYVGLLLVLHAAMPAAPYGSLAARGRTDPRGAWHHARSLWLVAWVLMALGYSYSGYTKLVSPSWLDGTALVRVLDNPLARPGFVRDLVLSLPGIDLAATAWSALALELLFAPLALVRLLRPWLWASMLAMHLSLMLLIDFADLSLGMVMLHLFTFDPRWLAPRGGPEPSLVFYDGGCGLCHGFVRLLLAEDAGGVAFRFASLQGETFAEVLPESERSGLPDSIVVLTPDGDRRVRSDALLHCLRRLGGAWRLLALFARLVPRPLRDLLYDGVAAVRTSIVPKPDAACPILPADLAARFRG